MAKKREEGCCSRFWRNSQAKILMMMSMNLTYFVVELVVGIMGKSTTLVIHTCQNIHMSHTIGISRPTVFTGGGLVSHVV